MFALGINPMSDLRRDVFSGEMPHYSHSWGLEIHSVHPSHESTIGKEVQFNIFTVVEQCTFPIAPCHS